MVRDYPKMCSEALNLLERTLKLDGTVKNILIPGRIIMRESIAPPPKKGRAELSPDSFCNTFQRIYERRELDLCDSEQAHDSLFQRCPGGNVTRKRLVLGKAETRESRTQEPPRRSGVRNHSDGLRHFRSWNKNLSSG